MLNEYRLIRPGDWVLVHSAARKHLGAIVIGTGSTEAKLLADMVVVGSIGCLVVKARMRAATIVKIEIASDPIACRADVVLGVE